MKIKNSKKTASRKAKAVLVGVRTREDFEQALVRANQLRVEWREKQPKPRRRMWNIKPFRHDF